MSVERGYEKKKIRGHTKGKVDSPEDTCYWEGISLCQEAGFMGRHAASQKVSHDWLKPQYKNKWTMNPSLETIEHRAKNIQ